MVAKLALVSTSGTTARSAGAIPRGPIEDGGAAGSAIPVSLRLLFVGRDELADWGKLRDMIKHAFGDAIEIATVARIADLGARCGSRQADIVFIQGTQARFSIKNRLRIGEFCPLASTIYLTTAPRQSGRVRSDSEAIHIVRSHPIAPERVFAAIFDAMRRQICCLKLALGASALNTPQPPNILERLFLLTPQETRILVAVRQGMPNKLVAHHLNITVRTVKAHLTEIFRKTGFAQRAELIAKCSELAATYDAALKYDISDLKPREESRPHPPFARRPTPKASSAPNSASPKVTPRVQRKHLCRSTGER